MVALVATAAESGKRRMVEEEGASYETPRYGMVPIQIIYDTQLSHTAVRVYAALAMHASKQGRCYPSQVTIAKEAGMSRQSVSAAINQLIERGYVLKVKQKRRDGGDDSCRYLLTQHPVSNSETPPVQKLDTPLSKNWTPPVQKLDTNRPIEQTNRTDQSEQTSASPSKVVSQREIAPSAVAEARPRVRSPHVTPSPGVVTAPSTAATPATPPTMAAQPPKVNPLWDVLMEIFNPTGETLTRVAKSNYGRVVRDLKEAGATPEEVRLRVDRYCARYGAQYLTINAIDKWWPEMGQEQQQKGTGANDAAAERRARERRDAEREAADEERAREAQITKALVAQYRRRHEAE